MDRGAVVRSLAGRDTGSLLAVVKSDGSYVYVCDGKERRLLNPKRKNPRHVEMLNAGTLPEESLASDRALRRALARIRDSFM